MNEWQIVASVATFLAVLVGLYKNGQDIQKAKAEEASRNAVRDQRIGQLEKDLDVVKGNVKEVFGRLNHIEIQLGEIKTILLNVEKAVQNHIERHGN